MEKALVRYVGEMFIALGMVVLIAGTGSVLGLTLYATRLQIPLVLFAGPTYLFFILAGSGLGYVVNRRQCSRAAPWVWTLPTIWSVCAATRDLGSGLHHGESVLGYIWNTLILGNHELALISQWMIGAPVLTALAYSFGAWVTVRRARATDVSVS